MFRADIIAVKSDLNEPSGASSDLNDDHVVKSTDMIPVKSDLNVKNDFNADLCSQELVITVVDPSLVEHKQDKLPVVVFQEDAQTVIVRPVLLDDSVRSARVTKKYANQRYVETDTLGTVFVGEKGNQIKMSQIINVKNGELYLGR